MYKKRHCAYIYNNVRLVRIILLWDEQQLRVKPKIVFMDVVREKVKVAGVREEDMENRVR